MGGALVKIAPLDGKIFPVGRLAVGGPIAFSGGKVYLGGKAVLRAYFYHKISKCQNTKKERDHCASAFVTALSYCL